MVRRGVSINEEKTSIARSSPCEMKRSQSWTCLHPSENMSIIWPVRLSARDPVIHLAFTETLNFLEMSLAPSSSLPPHLRTDWIPMGTIPSICTPFSFSSHPPPSPEQSIHSRLLRIFPWPLVYPFNHTRFSLNSTTLFVYSISRRWSSSSSPWSLALQPVSSPTPPKFRRTISKLVIRPSV